MKKFKFLLSACMAALLATSFTACSDDPAEGNGGNNNPEETTKDYHFDLFLSVGKHGGMSQASRNILLRHPAVKRNGGIEIVGFLVDILLVPAGPQLHGGTSFLISSDCKVK